MTPGDRMGGLPRLLEDAAQSLPILGPAIRGARGRGIVSMNVARVQDALRENEPRQGERQEQQDNYSEAQPG